MSGKFLKPLFADCKECNKVNYVDIGFLKRHYWQKHDYQELLKKADAIGIIDDLTKYHQKNIIIEKLANFACRGF